MTTTYAIALPVAAGAGSSVTFAGDLAGTSSSQTVVNLTGASSIVAVTATTIRFAASVAAPTYTQATPTTDVATQNLTFTSQAPFASATTNKAPGGMVFKIPAPVSGNFANMFSFQAGATTNLCTIGDWNSSGTAGIWLGTTATFAASTTNFALLGGTTTVLNGGSGVSIRVANTAIQTVTAAGIQLSGSLRQQEVTTSATTYVALTTDCVIFTDSTSNAVAITLPLPTTGLTITVKDKTGQAATHNVTINHHASETIDGATSLTMSTNFDAVVLVSDGTNWAVISKGLGVL